MPLNILLLIPCFNEEKSIKQTITRAKKAIPNVDILVIDNASNDATGKIAEEAGARVIFESQKGKGFAVRRGFLSLDPDTDLILMLDGDDTYGLGDMQAAINMISFKGMDMIVGRRKVSEILQVDERQDPFRKGHRVGNSVLSFYFKKLFGFKIDDSLSGWRLMTREFVLTFPGGVSSFEIEAELNAHAYSLHSSVGQIEVEYFGRLKNSDSKLQTYRDGFKIVSRNFYLFKRERPSLAFGILASPWLFSSAFFTGRVLLHYFVTSPHDVYLPSIIVAGALLVPGCMLVMSGWILERVRGNRTDSLRNLYSQIRYSRNLKTNS